MVVSLPSLLPYAGGRTLMVDESLAGYAQCGFETRVFSSYIWQQFVSFVLLIIYSYRRDSA